MLDDHIKSFIEEANELLSSLESSLLELEENPEDKEIISKVFRALHTIKGSGSMFGFDDIAVFTHDIETIYDLIRNGEIPVTREIINLTLQAKDQISSMLKSESGGSEIDDSAVSSLVAQFRNIVLNYRMVSGESPEGSKINTTLLNTDEHSHEDQIQADESLYYIFFRPPQNIYQMGGNPLLLLEELKQLGECFIFHHTENIPLLEDINPEYCYSNWEIILTSSKGQDAIKDVFIFIEDDCELDISLINKKEVSDAQEFFEFISTSYNENHQGLNKQYLLRSLIEEYRSKKAADRQSRQVKKQTPKEEKHTESEAVSNIRVSAEKLDNLVNLVGELVTVQARLSQTATKAQLPELAEIAEEVERLTWELRDSALNIRMLTIGTTFSKFKRLVRDLSQELGKEVELITEGAETELDKTVIEKLNDPLVHIIRNSIDHGIELPEERSAKGKPFAGQVKLSASQSGGNVLIKVADDGAGLNRERIREKAISKGLISSETELKDNEIYSLIFAPGFSTAKQITNVSGRGVGMDVVKQAIDSLRGSILVESKPSEGTTITLKLPLTLAIIDGLLVQVSEECFILPLSEVEECVELSEIDVKKSNGRNIINIRGEFIPYIRLRDNFSIQGQRPQIEQIVITTVNNMKVGFAVDNVIGSHQTVLKNLGRTFKAVENVSGATILGNGTVALILDTQKIVADEEIKEKKKSNSL
ncbi:MAG: chemotaxis protein CheA [Bacillota bacterium]